jgi:glycerol dehydrogenase-like iron-containing ADH family enzyme
MSQKKCKQLRKVLREKLLEDGTVHLSKKTYNALAKKNAKSTAAYNTWLKHYNYAKKAYTQSSRQMKENMGEEWREVFL